MVHITGLRFLTQCIASESLFLPGMQLHISHRFQNPRRGQIVPLERDYSEMITEPMSKAA